MDIKLKQNHVNIAMKTTGGVGTKDHAKLNNLDYEHSGHTGFASNEQIQELLALLNNKQDTLIAGDNISIVDNIISATGFTKDEIYIGPDEPTDPNIKIWIDTNEVAQEFYTKQEIDAKNFATEGWVSAQGYLTQHQDLSEYAKKSEIPTKVSAFENDAGYLTEHQSLENYALKTEIPTVPTKVSAFENDAGYLTQHQDLSGYALKTEIPTVPTNVSAFNNDAGYLTEHQSLENYALKTELPTEYVKSATVQGNKLTLTNKDNTTVEFEPSGGSGGGGTNYTFTDGLTETDGVVKWDLNDNIKLENKVLHGSTTKPFDYHTAECGFSFSTNVSENTNYTPRIETEGLVAVRINNTGSYSFNTSEAKVGYGGLTFGNIWGDGNDFSIYGNQGCLTGGVVEGTGANYNCGIQTVSKGSCAIGLTNKNLGYLQTLGIASQAFGAGVVVNSNYCMGHGICNIKDTAKTYAHIVGNGTSDSARSNAYTLDWQGNGTFAGTVSSSTGADYAEYFEWKDGNPNNEDRVGYIVTLDGDKIVKANTGDDILGICSGTAMVLGDSAEWNWSKRYLTDDFGRIIYEDYDVEHEEVRDENTGKVIEEAWTEHIHAPKQNPEYDASQPYSKRADRPEWQIVGMMGKIYVRDDGSCVVNGYADVKDGIATKANGKTNIRVMERVSDNIVRVLMK